MKKNYFLLALNLYVITYIANIGLIIKKNPDLLINKVMLKNLNNHYIILVLFFINLSYCLNLKKKITSFLFPNFILGVILLSLIPLKGTSFVINNIKNFIYLVELNSLISNIFLMYSFLFIYILKDSEIIPYLKEDKLSPKRKKDLSKIKHYLNQCNILGIEGEWGVGKSFLVKKLIEDLKKEKVEIIILNLANVNSGNIFATIINQLDKILIRNGVIEILFNRLKNVFSNQSFKGINFSNIFSSRTEKELLDDYKVAISKLNKKILIVFDDIDRINDIEKVSKSLNFGVEFGQNNLKVIYLYSEENLKGLGLKRNFLEKYIPFTLCLSKVSIKDMIKEKISLSLARKYDYNFIYALFDQNPSIYYSLNKLEEKEDLKFFNDYKRIFNNDIKINEVINFRSIDIFLKETKTLIENLKDDNIEIEERIVIAYCFVKNVLLSGYENIIRFDTIEKTFPIELSLGKIKFSIEELDLLFSILNKEISVETFYKEYYLKINNNRYKLEKINALFSKIDVEITKDNKLLMNGHENHLNQTKIKEKLQKFNISDCSKINFLIRSLFNQYLFTSTDSNIATERLESIENNIKKLNIAGEVTYKSSYKTAYKYIKTILKEDDLKKRKDLFTVFFNEYQYEKDYQAVYFWGENIYLKTLKIIATCGSPFQEKRFLEFLCCDGIDDNYLECLTASKVLKNKIIKWEIMNTLLIQDFKMMDEEIFINFSVMFNNSLCGSFRNSRIFDVSKIFIMLNFEKLLEEMDRMQETNIYKLGIGAKEVDITRKLIEKLLKTLENYKFIKVKTERSKVEFKEPTIYSDTVEELSKLSKSELDLELQKLFKGGKFNLVELEDIYLKLMNSKKKV